MIRLIQSALLWPKIRASYLNGDYRRAAAIAAEYRSKGIVDPIFEALEATLDVLTNNSTTAREKFGSLLRRIQSGKRRKNSEYIENYCLYYIDLINHEDGETHRRRALQASATNFARRALPLPPDRMEI